MATYKVIQDIEAEDKLLGPLTLRQFIYAGIVIVIGFINFQLYRVNPFLVFPLLLPMIFFAALAAPLGQDQPSEVWLLAKIRFLLKPRRRIWNQDGVSELVTITAPKKVEEVLTDGLSQTEVKSRLSALANTLDSRGWAVKNVNVSLYGQAGYLTGQQGDSDRLVSASSLPQDVPTIDVTALDDMMDADASPTAQNLTRMITQSEQTHRKELVQKMKAPAVTDTQKPNADYWFMNQADQQTPAKKGMAVFNNNPLFAPGTNQTQTNEPTPQTEAESALLNKLHKEKSHPNPAYGHTKTIQPLNLSGATTQPVATTPPTEPATQKPVAKPNIARLANNDDLNIATIAREAKRDMNEGEEVVISLH